MYVSHIVIVIAFNRKSQCNVVCVFESSTLHIYTSIYIYIYIKLLLVYCT